MTTKLRCIHRHTIDEHPACFAKGLIKYDFNNDREWERLLAKPWYTFPGYKIGYLDIEVDNLNADYGTMLTWAIKEKGGDVIYDYVTQEELMNGFTDRRIVQSIVDTMRKFKIIVGYYSTGFDIPFIRAKALHYGIDFPSYKFVEYADGKHKLQPEIYHMDLYYAVRRLFKISRKSLANATRYLGIPGKTPVTGEVWTKAKYGDPEALKEVLDHNIADVEITEALHDRLAPFSKWTRKGV